MAKINREALLKVLEAVQPGLSTREILEQSTCFIFSDGQVQALNDEIAATGPTTLPDDIRGAIKAIKLLEILRKLPEDELEVILKEGELTLIGKSRRAGVRVEAEIHHPLIAAVEAPKTWIPLHKDFAEAVSIVGLCASGNESIFSRVCIHVTPKWIEAHDGIQACRWYLPTGFSGEQRESGEWTGTLVRQSSIKHIVSLNMTEFAETPGWLHFRNSDGVTLACRRYVEDYPEDSTGEFAKDDGVAISLPKGLVDAADTASVFSSENSDANVVNVELKPGKVRVLGTGVSGYYREVKKVTYDGPTFNFLISPVLLADIVKRHSEVRMSPTRLRVNGGAYKYLACLFSSVSKSADQSEGE